MSNELVRFRVDPEVKDKAARICVALGLELNDALRAFVIRIARDGALPFDLSSTPAPPDGERRPFYNYDERLWSSLKSSADAEVALDLVTRFIADCSTRIDEERDARQPNAQLIAHLSKERGEARQAMLTLDVRDAIAVRKILAHFGPLVRVGTE